MPELPEVETTKEGLKRDLLGQKILKVEISDKKLRFPYDKNFIKRITCLLYTSDAADAS